MRPRLAFTPAGPNEGFRSSGLSIYSNIDPDTLLRELFQNAVDASRQGQRIEIRMKFESVYTREIPGIQEYKRALRESIDTQEGLGVLSNAKNITDTMEKCSNEEKIDILWILDNGIGLCPSHMSRLLGDGQSAKQDANNSGAFGNGHLTVFPASDLRFMVYGGVYEEERVKQRIFSGHTILASRQDRKRKLAFGKDGYIVQEFNAGDLFDRFVFCSASTDSPMLHSKLDEIESEFGTGSCVGILGFNHFNATGYGGGKRDLSKTIDTIERVASVHFLPLVYERKLEVSMYEGSKRIGAVDGDNLRDVLSRSKDQRRRRSRSIGPRGSHSWATLVAYEYGDRSTLSTSLGDIDVLVLKGRESDLDGTSVQLFRNGMWITNSVPSNESHRFQSRQCFTAVLLLHPEKARRACELIRDCEGPRHIDISPTRLGRNSDESKEFDTFFKEIHDQLTLVAPEKSTEEFDPGFLVVDTVGHASSGSAPNGRNRVSIDEIVVPVAVEDRDKSEFSAYHVLSRLISSFKTKYSIVFREGSLNLVVKPMARADRIVLRLKRADGVDATCDAPLRPTFLEFGRSIVIGGQEAKILSLEPSFVDENDSKDKAEDQVLAVEFGPVLPRVEIQLQIPFNKLNGEGVQPIFYRSSKPRKNDVRTVTSEVLEAND